MGFDLLLAMLIAYYMTRNTVQDLVYKATGQDPPSYRREQERIKRREARRPITDRREGRKFWANAWHDAWESAGERRERIHNRRVKMRREAWDAEDAAVPEVVEVDEGDAYEWKAPELDVEPAPEPAPEPRQDRVPDPEPTPVEPGHAASRPEPAYEPYYPLPPVSPPFAAEADEDGDDAVVIQMGDRRRFPEPITQEADMAHSGETTNLNAGLAYTSSMADTCREGVVSVETSLSGLQAGGVTGPTLDALTQASESLSSAAANFAAAYQALANHIAVQEAYAANADAGSKEFVTAD